MLYSENKELLLGKIKSIKSVGFRDVYDITVNKDNSYLAEGFVNHNSSSDPNVQNIPNKGDTSLRPLIIARPNHKLITSDLSQFEFRAAAAYTKEQYLIDAFEERYQLLPDLKELASKFGFTDPDDLAKAVLSNKLEVSLGENEVIRTFAATDIHRRNAALVTGKSPRDIDNILRALGKTLGYALLYGCGPDKMFAQLIKAGFFETSVSMCKEYRKIFLTQLPKMDQFIKDIYDQIFDPGYVSTFSGRKRFFDVPSRYNKDYHKIIGELHRSGTNFVFQGSNADALKLAMVMMGQAFREVYPEEIMPYVLLNVHDEVIVEAHNDIVNDVSKIVQNCMLEAANSSVNYLARIESSLTISDFWNH
jgi:DNA polymerase I-like protein with 3'-5' exonuclease and polymerase domains